MTRAGGMPEFFAPLALAAVAVLAVNDHVLKARYHDAVTGKLSDIAVCFFLPLFLSAVAGLVCGAPGTLRLTVAAVVTVALYATLELSPQADRAFCAVNDAVAPLLGLRRACRLTRDPTDLWALALVPASVWYGRARLRRAGAA